MYAIRSGPWKWIEGIPLARPGKKPPGKQGPRVDPFRPQRFNLQTDPGETQDVATQHSDVVKRLSATLRQQRGQGFSRPQELMKYRSIDLPKDT
jgi:hypothetical protein